MSCQSFAWPCQASAWGLSAGRDAVSIFSRAVSSFGPGAQIHQIACRNAVSRSSSDVTSICPCMQKGPRGAKVAWCGVEWLGAWQHIRLGCGVKLWPRRVMVLVFGGHVRCDSERLRSGLCQGVCFVMSRLSLSLVSKSECCVEVCSMHACVAECRVKK